MKNVSSGVIMHMTVILLALLAVPMLAGAQGVNIHGFVSQGYMQSTDNQFLVNSEDGSFEYNEFALNASANPTDRLRVGVQLIGRDLGTLGNDAVRIDWAFGDYRWRDWAGVRVGKIKQPAGFYNKGRDVDMLRTLIVLPQGVYNEEARDFMLAYEGVNLYGFVGLGKAGRLSYELFGGTKNIVDPGDGWWGIASVRSAQAITSELPGLISLQSGGMIPPEAVNAGLLEISDHSVSFSNIYGASLEWKTPLSGLRVGASYFGGQFDVNYKSVHVASYPTGDPSNPTATQTIESSFTSDMRVSNFSIYSAEYVRGRFTFAAEFLNFSVDKMDIFVNGDQVEDDFANREQGYYGMVDYRVNNWLSVAGAYSEYYTNADNKDGEMQSYGFATPSTFEDWHAWQKDLTLGARFNLNTNWLLKLEMHSINGVAQLDPLANDQQFEENWMLFAAKTTLFF